MVSSRCKLTIQILKQHRGNIVKNVTLKFSFKMCHLDSLPDIQRSGIRKTFQKVFQNEGISVILKESIG